MPKETNRGPNPQLRLQSWAFSPPAVPLLLPDLAHVRRQTAVDAPLNLWRNQRVTQLQQVSKRIRFRSHKRSNAYVHTLCIHIAMLAAIRMLNAEQDARSIGKEAALCTKSATGSLRTIAATCSKDNKADIRLTLFDAVLCSIPAIASGLTKILHDWECRMRVKPDWIIANVETHTERFSANSVRKPQVGVPERMPAKRRARIRPSFPRRHETCWHRWKRGR